MPFVRLGRDIFHPEQGLVNNPMRVPEKIFGMPASQLQRGIKKKRKAIEEGTRYKQPKVGI